LKSVARLSLPILPLTLPRLSNVVVWLSTKTMPLVRNVQVLNVVTSQPMLILNFVNVTLSVSRPKLTSQMQNKRNVTVITTPLILIVLTVP